MYRSVISGYGKDIGEFLEQGLLIVFSEEVPDALREISMQHNYTGTEDNMEVGDIVRIGSRTYRITAVGESANETFRTMGHCTFCFEGSARANLPGEVHLIGEGLPLIAVGAEFQIKKNDPRESCSGYNNK